MPDDADDDEPIPRNQDGMPESGASTLAQRDASGEVDEGDLKVGERRRGGQRIGAASVGEEPERGENQTGKRKFGSDENNRIDKSDV